MIGIPIQLARGGERGPMTLVMIVEKENLDRMKEGDPLDFQPRSLPPGQFNWQRAIQELDIIIAYEEDRDAIEGYIRVNDLAGLIAHLERGRRHRPGDARPPYPWREP